MAEESDLERTEPASQRRLEQARERGQVPRSPELSSFAVLMAAGGGFLWMGAALVDALEGVMRAGLTLDHAATFDAARLGARLYDGAAAALLGFAPWFLLVAAVGILAPTLMSGWLFTFQPLQPDLSRLDPARGLGRIFSRQGVIESGKALLKIAAVGAAAAWALWAERAEIATLLSEPLQPGLAHLGHLLGATFLIVAGALALIVALDLPLRLWDHGRQLRMSRDEVRAELKETEGDPLVKARIRALQREMTRRRMMLEEVPRADAVVTDPGRCAVALRYAEDTMRTPRVVARGALRVAERIVDLARANDVPVLSAPALARALLAHAAVGRDIPAPLYDAVADVLAWVYQLRRFRTAGGERPREPGALPVPPELDPGRFSDAEETSR
ncbi:MAG TPA: flagellar type III secretion system protein FlhB [Burkholderiales bacterium]|nr:flagellar type III secretion system protein FlhB [Burkholderiales bacterium]